MEHFICDFNQRFLYVILEVLVRATREFRTSDQRVLYVLLEIVTSNYESNLGSNAQSSNPLSPNGLEPIFCHFNQRILYVLLESKIDFIAHIL